MRRVKAAPIVTTAGPTVPNFRTNLSAFSAMDSSPSRNRSISFTPDIAFSIAVIFSAPDTCTANFTNLVLAATASFARAAAVSASALIVASRFFVRSWSFSSARRLSTSSLSFATRRWPASFRSFFSAASLAFASEMSTSTFADFPSAMCAFTRSCRRKSSFRCACVMSTSSFAASPCGSAVSFALRNSASFFSADEMSTSSLDALFVAEDTSDWRRLRYSSFDFARSMLTSICAFCFGVTADFSCAWRLASFSCAADTSTSSFSRRLDMASADLYSLSSFASFRSADEMSMS